MLCNDWKPNGSATWDKESGLSEDTALHGQAVVLGVPFHVTAIRVYEDEDGFQRAVDPAWEPELENIFALNGDVSMMTVEIEGHDGEYVLAIYPHSL